MGKLVYLMGKSSSGKDTIYRELMNSPELKLKKVVMYTTRPIRDNEKDGIQYHFVSDEEFEDLLNAGKVIEYREYNTMLGVWRYFTVDDGNLDFEHHNYMIIGTLESYEKTIQYYEKKRVLPIYIEVDDGIRLQRAINREMMQDKPQYEEMCRRFLADAKDFSDEKLENAGISIRFNNEDLKGCLSQVKEYLTEYL